MRRRINLLALAVTSLVVVAFVVPLALLVRRQADQAARVAVENDTQTVAAVVVRSVAAEGRTVSRTDLAETIGSLPDHVSVLLPDGVLGSVDPNPALVEQAGTARTALSTYDSRGNWELALPVITRDQPVIVFARVPAEELTAGVAGAWLLLAALGLGLIAGSVLLADRLGRSVVTPSERLAGAAHRLGQGDLHVRVREEGPEELVAVAAAFNTLAARVRELLAAERESIADLSHRLRTPLTAVRLQAEQIDDPVARSAVLGQVDRLQQAVDELIAEARRRPGGADPRADLVAIVAQRAAFWEVLADEQHREMALELPRGPLTVSAPPAELTDALDALIGNVFAHTQAGTGFRISVACPDRRPAVTVADGGEGFRGADDPTERGRSGTGSTGLGLDIARRVAERSGGELKVGTSPEGGAMVQMVFGILADPAAEPGREAGRPV